MNKKRKPLRIAVITNILPVYRQGFYDRLFAREDFVVDVFCQKYIPGLNIKTIHQRYPNNAQLVSFFSLSKERVSWQFIPWRKIHSCYDVVFIDGNPRVLSDLLYGTLLRVLGKKVVLWTMVHSYRNNSIREYFRLLWTYIFKYILVYNDGEAISLKQRGFKNNIVLGINNGLDQKKIDSIISVWPIERLIEWRQKNGLDKRILILSCARLDRKNRFIQVVDALSTIVAEHPEVLWCVIGQGEESINIKKAVIRTGIDKHVRFIGELYEEEELAPWFLSAEIFVHPMGAGLSILHAFGYGLPIVVSNNKASHGPEYGAFESGQTGLAFKEDDIKMLSANINYLLGNVFERNLMKERALRLAREVYNVDVMVERFIQIAEKAAEI